MVMNRNCGMTNKKMLRLTVILHLYSTRCDYCDMNCIFNYQAHRIQLFNCVFRATVMQCHNVLTATSYYTCLYRLDRCILTEVSDHVSTLPVGI